MNADADTDAAVVDIDHCMMVVDWTVEYLVVEKE